MHALTRHPLAEPRERDLQPRYVALGHGAAGRDLRDRGVQALAGDVRLGVQVREAQAERLVVVERRTELDSFPQVGGGQAQREVQRPADLGGHGQAFVQQPAGDGGQSGARRGQDGVVRHVRVDGQAYGLQAAHAGGRQTFHDGEARALHHHEGRALRAAAQDQGVVGRRAGRHEPLAAPDPQAVPFPGQFGTDGGEVRPRVLLGRGDAAHTVAGQRLPQHPLEVRGAAEPPQEGDRRLQVQVHPHADAAQACAPHLLRQDHRAPEVAVQAARPPFLEQPRGAEGRDRLPRKPPLPLRRADQRGHFVADEPAHPVPVTRHLTVVAAQQQSGPEARVGPPRHGRCARSSHARRSLSSRIPRVLLAGIAGYLLSERGMAPRRRTYGLWSVTRPGPAPSRPPPAARRG